MGGFYWKEGSLYLCSSEPCWRVVAADCLALAIVYACVYRSAGECGTNTVFAVVNNGELNTPVVHASVIDTK